MRKRANMNQFLVVSVLLCIFVNIPRGTAWNPEQNGRMVKRPPSPVSLSTSRRQVHQQILLGLFSGILLSPVDAQAGEVGARINAAVTKSDLGISVRRSVVKGAQIMDGIDGQWEQFSDRFRLGANRAGQTGKPAPKTIPPPQPLDSQLAAKLLDVSDETFVALSKSSRSALETQIRKVGVTVAPSFERSGLDIQAIDTKSPRNGDEFNFLCYTHYKAYTDLIIDQKLDFRAFQSDYEKTMGDRIRQMLMADEKALATQNPSGTLSDANVRQVRWNDMTNRLQDLSNALIQKGLIAQIDMSYDEDDLSDWLDDAVTDLQFNVALDGDVTMGSQILLQEQGFRLYPNYGRYAIRNLIQATIGRPIEITDYYMDTDYNSDPEKFQVKEVLLSIVLESA